MKACMNYGFPFGQPCCQDSLNIKVKNCGHFYVYYLVRTNGCPTGYCAGKVSKHSLENGKYGFYFVGKQLLYNANRYKRVSSLIKKINTFK